MRRDAALYACTPVPPGAASCSAARNTPCHKTCVACTLHATWNKCAVTTDAAHRAFSLLLLSFLVAAVAFISPSHAQLPCARHSPRNACSFSCFVGARLRCTPHTTATKSKEALTERLSGFHSCLFATLPPLPISLSVVCTHIFLNNSI
jgi:hypothetical protein